MAMSGTNAKPPTGISPPRAQSPFNKASTPLNTTGGALGTSPLNSSFALQGKKRFFVLNFQIHPGFVHCILGSPRKQSSLAHKLLREKPKSNVFR